MGAPRGDPRRRLGGHAADDRSRCWRGSSRSRTTCTRRLRWTARTTWQRFRTITLPQLKPVIIAITALDFIWNFNSFGLVYVLTEGGPAGKTELPMLFAYNQAFKYGEFGYAAALGCTMVARHRERAGLLPLRPRPGDDGVIVSSNPKRRESAQYVALALYVVFLGFPLLWMLSVSLKGPRGARRAPSVVHPGEPDARELPHRARRQRARPERDQQPQGRARHGDRDDAHRAARRLRPRAPARDPDEHRARLDPAQPDVPADPDHHPALPAPARHGPHELAPRARARLRRLGAALRPVDAAELRARDPARARGGCPRRRGDAVPGR